MTTVHIVRLHLRGTGNSKGKIKFWRAGRPWTSVKEENDTDVRKILEDRQLEEILDLNTPATNSILKHYLHVTKLCCFCVSHSLTENQKTRHLKWCQEVLKIFDKISVCKKHRDISGSKTIAFRCWFLAVDFLTIITNDLIKWIAHPIQIWY